VFWFSGPIFKFLGNSGAKTVSKLASLILAAIAVKLVRQGIMAIISGG
jgi:multiple antibiotic resistance protein